MSRENENIDGVLMEDLKDIAYNTSGTVIKNDYGFFVVIGRGRKAHIISPARLGISSVPDLVLGTVTSKNRPVNLKEGLKIIDKKQDEIMNSED